MCITAIHNILLHNIIIHNPVLHNIIIHNIHIHNPVIHNIKRYQNMSKSKKNFLDNPALRFIDIPQEEEEEQEQEQETAPVPAESEKPETPERTQTAPDELRAAVNVPEGYRLEKIAERRTKRLQLVVEPSLHDRLKAAAKDAGVSVNEFAIRALNEKIGKIGGGAE